MTCSVELSTRRAANDEKTSLSMFLCMTVFTYVCKHSKWSITPHNGPLHHTISSVKSHTGVTSSLPITVFITFFMNESFPNLPSVCDQYRWWRSYRGAILGKYARILDLVKKCSIMLPVFFIFFFMIQTYSHPNKHKGMAGLTVFVDQVVDREIGFGMKNK